MTLKDSNIYETYRLNTSQLLNENIDSTINRFSYVDDDVSSFYDSEKDEELYFDNDISTLGSCHSCPSPRKSGKIKKDRLSISIKKKFYDMNEDDGMDGDINDGMNDDGINDDTLIYSKYRTNLSFNKKELRSKRYNNYIDNNEENSDKNKKDVKKIYTSEYNTILSKNNNFDYSNSSPENNGKCINTSLTQDDFFCESKSSEILSSDGVMDYNKNTLNEKAIKLKNNIYRFVNMDKYDDNNNNNNKKKSIIKRVTQVKKSMINEKKYGINDQKETEIKMFHTNELNDSNSNSSPE
ncbi:conserved protein, unknown function, partial [Hepatocystis sp. ex Piliocolobus tephrosceles]